MRLCLIACSLPGTSNQFLGEARLELVSDRPGLLCILCVESGLKFEAVGLNAGGFLQEEISGKIRSFGKRLAVRGQNSKVEIIAALTPERLERPQGLQPFTFSPRSEVRIQNK